MYVFFFSSRRRHTRLQGDWSSDVCSSDLAGVVRLDDAGRLGDADRAQLVVQVVAARPVAGGEIGRASCRERVLVSVVVGAVVNRRRMCVVRVMYWLRTMVNILYDTRRCTE